MHDETRKNGFLKPFLSFQLLSQGNLSFPPLKSALLRQRGRGTGGRGKKPLSRLSPALALFLIAFLAPASFAEKAGPSLKKPAESASKTRSLKKSKELKKTAQSAQKKQPGRRARQPASAAAYNCSETFQDKYSPGYIQVGYGCNSEESLCVAFYHIERNYCENSHLIRFYCDPARESLFSSEKILCKKGCSFSGLSGACNK